jgi:hypothetical protein
LKKETNAETKIHKPEEEHLKYLPSNLKIASNATLNQGHLDSKSGVTIEFPKVTVQGTTDRIVSLI